MKRMHWKNRLQKKKLNAKKKSNQQNKVPKLLPELPEARNQIPLHLKLQVQHLRSEEHTSELQSRGHLVCRLPLEKKEEIQQVHEHLLDHVNHTVRVQVQHTDG